MNGKAQLLAICREAARHVDGRALLDVLQNLLVARFVADDQQAATRFLHRLQSVVVGRDARSAAPGEVQSLQLGAEFDGAGLLVVEGVVVEEDFLQARKVFQRPAAFVHDVVRRAQTPAVARVGLRPQAESALRRTAASRIERDIGI